MAWSFRGLLNPDCMSFALELAFHALGRSASGIWGGKGSSHNDLSLSLYVLIQNRIEYLYCSVCICIYQNVVCI